MGARTKALEQAVAHAAQARQELEEYRRWKAGERERIYGLVLHQEVSLADLERLKALLAELEEKEALIEKKIMMADKAVEEAQRALEEAREAWRKALSNLQKLEEHREIWMEEARVEEERAMEKETEELRTVGLGAVGLDHDEY